MNNELLLTSSHLNNSSLDDSTSQSSEETKYDEINILKQLCNSRFPIFLVHAPRAGKYLALKAFPFQGDGMNESYLNESRFINLNHPNIIKFFDAVDQQEVPNQPNTTYFSYLLMELAICDFADLLKLIDFTQDDVLCRTYFSQLIDGLEYLHSENIAHMDIKLENLLLGGDYQLKIIDFDFAHKEGDDVIVGKGTTIYRAPELLSRKCKKPKLSDIYSAGIILFTFRVGCLPYSEEGPIGQYDLKKLLREDPDAFWKAHENIQGKNLQLEESFKSLFISMVQEVPEKRATINEIRSSDWMNGPIYSSNEIYSIMSRLFR